jgi:RimJ/RimL family protein N-acetyltransferase
MGLATYAPTMTAATNIQSLRAAAQLPGEGDSAAPVRIRRVRSGDSEALRRFYADLSPDSRQLRFLGAVAGLSDPQATKFCTPDHHHREGFVAIGPAEPGVPDRIIGHLCLEPDGEATAEVAIAIADAWQHRGLGSRLLKAGIRWARASGITCLRASMYAANPGIHRLLLGLGMPSSERFLAPGIAEMTIDLAGDSLLAA